MTEPTDIRTKPPCYREDAAAVLKQLREAGHVAYFAGGCVRDLLLALEPKDWDVATDAPPQRVRQLFRRTQAVGAAFGVILVRQGRSQVEVATFRAEGKYLDGRRPSEVHFTNAEEDARRRDFTINGLFLDPLDNDRVIDFVGGLEDLKLRRLRAIGDPFERFREDHLRLLRAVRFAARFNLQIDPATAAAVKTDAPLLRHISPERIADELRRMLTPPSRSVAWKLLWQFDLLPVIFRFLSAGATGPLAEPQSIFLSVAHAQPIPFGLAIAAGVLCYLWHQAGKPADLRPLLSHTSIHRMVRAMRQGLKISNDESDQMEQSLEGIEPLLQDEPPRLATIKRFLARPTAPLSQLLLDAIDRIGLLRDRIAWLGQQFARLDHVDCAPPPLISGDDLTAAGLQPGPIFKRLLDEVYDAQLEGRVSTREDALKLAMHLAGG